MTGNVSPAWAATSVKWARKGIPDGFPLGRGFRFRVDTPWAKPTVDAVVIHRKSRREMWVFPWLIVGLGLPVLPSHSVLISAQHHHQTPSRSANLLFYYAIPLSWRTPARLSLFVQARSTAAQGDSERRVATDPVSPHVPARQLPPGFWLGRRKRNQDRSRPTGSRSATEAPFATAAPPPCRHWCVTQYHPDTKMPGR